MTLHLCACGLLAGNFRFRARNMTRFRYPMKKDKPLSDGVLVSPMLN